MPWTRSRSSSTNKRRGKEQPPKDSFCIWCHRRDEREARKFIRNALKTTPRTM
jgi:hypothetical protein